LPEAWAALQLRTLTPFVRLIAGTEALSDKLAADAVTTDLAPALDEDVQTHRVRLRFLQVSYARHHDCDILQDPTSTKHTFLRCSLLCLFMHAVRDIAAREATTTGI
jgi:hypothetical protein